jgi:hypothetical protein
VFLVCCLIVTLGGCRNRNRTTVKNEEDGGPPRLASVLKMGDPATQTQLAAGFHQIEEGAWRWTAGKFSVALRAPLASSQYGATLTLAFRIPDVSIARLGPLSLTAAIGTTKLKTEKCTSPGAHTLTADVPPELLAEENVRIDFTLDKYFPAGAVEGRELGVIANSVGLEGK